MSYVDPNDLEGYKIIPYKHLVYKFVSRQIRYDKLNKHNAPSPILEAEQDLILKCYNQMKAKCLEDTKYIDSWEKMGEPVTRKMKIYTASKVKHAQKWIQLREQGYNIISSWIDEAGEGQTSDYVELSERCIKECEDADIVLLYQEHDDMLKGALIEAGLALGAGVEVRFVGKRQYVSRVFRKHPLWSEYKTIEDALK